jgi:hypothetical protein
MNPGAGPLPDFLQRTLGIRGVTHNRHAGVFRKYFGAVNGRIGGFPQEIVAETALDGSVEGRKPLQG